MPKIRPSSDLRNHYNEISDFCHQYPEAVYITKNGQGDLAVMSIETYERIAGKLELYRLVDGGIADIQHGRVESLDAAFEEIERTMTDEAI